MLLLINSNESFSQGDDCAQALPLSNLSNFCSNAGQYTNVGATPSTYSAATCWTGSPLEDVWFSFVCVGTDVLVAVNGSTISRPRIAIYSGSCGGTLTQMGCANGTLGSPNSQLYLGGLVQGTTYFIRISSLQNNEGTFQLCINNYIPPPSASADCSGAGKLCNKNPISIVGLSGGGSNNNEANGTCIGDGVFMFETNSVWYTWTCLTSGTLTFDLLPANQLDDIDFVVFQLSTADPCGPRNAIRCTAASCINGLASTGMNMSSTDFTEAAGCFAPSDAYVRYIDMVAGTSYALLINNASAANGFTLNWGGTGTFVGPDANITGSPYTICAGSPFSFDGSTSTGYSSLNWNFANGSGTPGTATGPGPVSVTYATGGTYTAILNAVSSTGCTSTDAVQITVNPILTPAFAAQPNICQNATAPVLPTTSTNGVTGTWSPAVSTATPGTTTYTFTPNGGQCANPTTLNLTVIANTTISFASVAPFCQGTIAPAFPSQTNLPVIPGTWSPSAISNNASATYLFTPTVGQCASPVSINVTVNPLPIVTASSNAPLCEGFDLNFSGNTVPGATYDWDGPSNYDSSLEDPIIASVTASNAGTYTLHITDANGCTNLATTNVIVNTEIIPVLTPAGPFCESNTTPVTLIADIPGGTWTGNGITNPAGEFTPSVAGHGTHTITYTHTQGCGGSNTMTIVVDSVPPANFVADTLSGCGPLTVHFTSDPGMTSSIWDFGTGPVENSVGGITHVFTASGSYTIALTNTLGGCSALNTIPNYIQIFPSPTANFYANRTELIQTNTEVHFINESSDAISYSWDFGDSTPVSNAENVNHTYPTTPGSYTVTLTTVSAGGCIDKKTMIIIVLENQIIYVPNAFTPDGDEYNNTFLPILSEGFDVLSYHLNIFDRWGEVVFESMDYEIGWDGTYHDKLVPTGTYTWTIKVKNKSNDKYNEYTGHISVMR